MGEPFYPHIVMKARFYERRDRPGRWIVTLYWKGKRHYRGYYDNREPLSSERLALRIAEQINGDIEEKGRAFDPRRWFQPSGHEMAFKVYAEKWLVQQDHYAPSTRRDVERHTYQAINYFGLRDLREIRGGALEDFSRQLPEHLSPKSKKNILITIHKLFADAFRREDIPRIPPFPMVSVAEPEIKWLSLDWQDRVIKAIPEQDRPIFIFLRTYGVRPGEARALQWDCVDLEKGIITIRRAFSASILRETTKTRRIRRLPIVEPISNLLATIRGIAGFVFRNRWGRPYGADLSKLWNRAVEQVGAPKVNLYQGTRHSLGCQKISDGHSLDIIRDILGHTRVEMTRRYAQAGLEGMKRVLDDHPRTDGEKVVDIKKK